MVEIKSKIVDVGVVDPNKESEVSVRKCSCNCNCGKQQPVVLPRPEILEGSTYKISPTNKPHSYYLTINDYITDDGRRLPFEIFISSKDSEALDVYQALMLVISGILRGYCSSQTSDPTFLVRQLKSALSYDGPYVMPGGKKYGSLVSHIASYIEFHFIKVGLLKTEENCKYLEEKRDLAKDRGLLASARQCACGEFSLVRLDGCDTCLTCGASRC